MATATSTVTKRQAQSLGSAPATIARDRSGTPSGKA